LRAEWPGRKFCLPLGQLVMLRPLSVVAALLGAWGPAEAQQLRDLFRTVSPSVVVVRTVERGLAPEPSAGLVAIPGLGSGVLISADGKVLTAAHVVQVADRVVVEFMDGKVYPAHVVASSARADVALLQLDRTPKTISPAPLADSDKLEVGDQIVVIGAPYGLGHSLTVGHVSGRLTIDGIVSGVPMEVLQTDAAINMGNSGGPMFNLQGEVVGIVSSILSQSGGFEGVGFAVPANVAQKVLLTAPSFWTGMDGILLQDTLARIFNLPQPAGLLVQQVAAGSPAAVLGLRAGTWRATIGTDHLLVGGDILLDVAGIEVAPNGASFDRMQGVLGKLRPGDSVTARVLRGGRVVPLSAVKPR
jgi:serine protease Do